MKMYNGSNQMSQAKGGEARLTFRAGGVLHNIEDTIKDSCMTEKLQLNLLFKDYQ